MRKLPAVLGIAALLPYVAHAASIQGLIKNVLTFANNILLPFLLGIAFLFIVYNAFKFFIVEGATKDGQTKAKNLAIYGVLAFVFIVIFWGLVNFFAENIGLSGQKAPAFDYLEQYKKNGAVAPSNEPLAQAGQADQAQPNPSEQTGSPTSEPSTPEKPCGSLEKMFDSTFGGPCAGGGTSDTSSNTSSGGNGTSQSPSSSNSSSNNTSPSPTNTNSSPTTNTSNSTNGSSPASSGGFAIENNTESIWCPPGQVLDQKKKLCVSETTTTESSFSEARAMAFIKSLYNPERQMLMECPTCTKYWLWSDQLLGVIALRSYDPTTAKILEDKMNSYGVEMKNMWATLDSRYLANAKFSGTQELQVGQSDVWYSDYGVGGELACANYADIAFMKAIYKYRTGDTAGARTCYDYGKAMWDGVGMKDAGQITGDYAVYKVALGMLAQKVTGFPAIGIPENYFDKFQAANGGITTDIKNGKPDGSQNIETTTAVLLAKNPSLMK